MKISTKRRSSLPFRSPGPSRTLIGALTGALTGVLGLTLTLSPLAAQASPRVEVLQGSVGQWSGAGTVSCGMDGATWAALDETCFYPVDLERAPGTIEIARWKEGSDIETAWLVVQDREFELQEIEIDDKFVHLSEENLARHHQEQAEIKAQVKPDQREAQFELPLAEPLNPPIPEGRFFGVRREFNGEPRDQHSGMDYAVGVGNPVKAVADGKVVLTGDHFFAGNSVYVDHGDDLVSMYFHLSAIGVEVGQEVKRGDTLGKVGSTGRTTGPHLHLGVHWRKAQIDPSVLLTDPKGLPSVVDGAADEKATQSES